MKLTNSIRDKLIRNVMADIPEIDYENQIYERAKFVCIQSLPETIKRIWENLETRHYLICGYSYLENRMPCVTPGYARSDADSLINSDKTLKELYNKKEEQEQVRDRLENEIKKAIYSVNTDKSFLEFYPELSKYFPENVICKTLPIQLNLIKDLKDNGLAI